MEIFPIKTRAMLPPKDDIYNVLDEFCPALREGDVLVVASKIVAIHQGRCVLKSEIKDKNDLIKKEADILFPSEETDGGVVITTIKGNTLVPFAGIDESNANGYYILWPEDPDGEAGRICEYLKKKFSLKNLALIIADSYCVPLRRGTMGISIGFYGLNPANDYRKKIDIFGRTLGITRFDVVDSLAAAGVSVMGEGDERQPVSIIRGADFVEFRCDKSSRDSAMPFKEDIFYPLLENFRKP
ncbi:MAG: coenzyme F420-0:L-glutamate ligase [Candidatus Pacebacteria bacterium]|nr:coenzyme F420-0:L-glutamate ligase [Candidatus Paceibacterota bacterium]